MPEKAYLVQGIFKHWIDWGPWQGQSGVFVQFGEGLCLSSEDILQTVRITKQRLVVFRGLEHLVSDGADFYYALCNSVVGNGGNLLLETTAEKLLPLWCYREFEVCIHVGELSLHTTPFWPHVLENSEEKISENVSLFHLPGTVPWFRLDVDSLPSLEDGLLREWIECFSDRIGLGAHYLLSRMYLTTSSNFDTPAQKHFLQLVQDFRVLFGVTPRLAYSWKNLFPDSEVILGQVANRNHPGAARIVSAGNS